MYASVSGCSTWIVIITVVIFSIKGCVSLSSEEAVKRFFRYFDKEEPVGIPVMDPPEPMDLPSPLELLTITLKDGKLGSHSLAKFHQLEMDFVHLTGSLKCWLPKLSIQANYTWPGIFYPSEGEINASLTDVDLYVNFSMLITEGNILQVKDFQEDLEVDDLFLDMTNLQWSHQFLIDSGSVNIFFFDILYEIVRELKPLLLDGANGFMAGIFASLPKVDESQWELISGRSDPLGGTSKADHTAFFLRRVLLYFGTDPLFIPAVHTKQLGMQFVFSDIRLEGLSFIRDIRTLRVVYQEKKIYVISEMLYPHLLLKTQARVRAFVLATKNYVTLDMENARIRVQMVIDPSQSDPPRLTDINLSIGGFTNLNKGRGFFRKVWSKSAKNIFNFLIGEIKGSIRNVIQRKLDVVRLEEAALQFINHQ